MAQFNKKKKLEKNSTKNTDQKNMHLLGLVVEAAASGAGNAVVVVAVKVSSAGVSVC